jgi:NDP-sugar pyrophosphorylase family protein
MPGGKVSLEQEIFPKLIASRELLGFVTKQRFYDIGTPERLERIAHLLK